MFYELEGFGVLAVRGADNVSFLQGQISTDCARADPDTATLSAYHTNKGRVTAILKLVRWDDALLLSAPRDVLRLVTERLRSYVLRSRVEFEDVTDRFGWLGVVDQPLRSEIEATVRKSPAQLVKFELPGDDGPIEFFSERAVIASLREQVDLDTRDQGEWELAYVRAGVPMFPAALADAFTPQSVNLDLLRALDFGKGCYIGQEIIARIQHLGRIKRRTLRFAADATGSAVPGEAILCDDEPVGQLVLAARDETDRLELLAALQLSALEADLRLADGTVLERAALPYPIPEL